jgi:hypothetical protein
MASLRLSWPCELGVNWGDGHVIMLRCKISNPIV